MIPVSYQLLNYYKDYLMSCLIITGLREQVKFEVMSKHPATMVKTMRLAKLEEDKQESKVELLSCTFEFRGNNSRHGYPSEERTDQCRTVCKPHQKTHFTGDS